MPSSYYKAEVARARREALKAAHMCTVCGAPLPPEETRTTCDSCRRFMASYERDRREKRVAARLCAKCGAPMPADLKTKLCRACALKQKRASLKYKNKKRSDRFAMEADPRGDKE